jgi:hypothetical protein
VNCVFVKIFIPSLKGTEVLFSDGIKGLADTKVWVAIIFLINDFLVYHLRLNQKARFRRMLF